MDSSQNEAIEKAYQRLRKSNSVINFNTFEQILEMDDDPFNRKFSRELVRDFFYQVNQTLLVMDTNLLLKNLNVLSELGHFLKGSSAALGLEGMRASCERIQTLGLLKGENGELLAMDTALNLLSSEISLVKQLFDEVKIVLGGFYTELEEYCDSRIQI